MTIGLTQHHALANANDQLGILSPEAQRKAFRQARRHTFVVKLLKFLLPLASLGILSLYFIPNGTSSLVPDLPVSIDSINLSGKGLKMINPHYSGGNKKIGNYEVRAEYALQNIKTTNILELHKIAGNIHQTGNKWLQLKAQKGVFDTQSEIMSLSQGIDITTNQGMAAHLKNANINMKKQHLVTSSPVQMSLNGNIIKANNMDLSIARKRILFGGGVEVKLLKNKSLTK